MAATTTTTHLTACIQENLGVLVPEKHSLNYSISVLYNIFN